MYSKFQRWQASRVKPTAIWLQGQPSYLLCHRHLQPQAQETCGHGRSLISSLWFSELGRLQKKPENCGNEPCDQNQRKGEDIILKMQEGVKKKDTNTLDNQLENLSKKITESYC